MPRSVAPERLIWSSSSRTLSFIANPTPPVRAGSQRTCG
jgi:hypothetical protein